jgi:hypothetical protein
MIDHTYIVTILFTYLLLKTLLKIMIIDNTYYQLNFIMIEDIK